MGDLNHEPSMEDILASIKRIIAEDGEGAPAVPRRAARRNGAATTPPLAGIDDEGTDDGVLELTDRVEEPEAVTPANGDLPSEEPAIVAEELETGTEDAPPLVSQPAERASRDAIAALSALVVKPETPGADSLEGLVRDMLRPMLKQWLDARLPDIVEQIVQREIARIVGNR